MTHGSLFSGIGGFDLASQWMGWENVFHCEWNEFGQKILKYYWPNAISYTDITKTDFSIHRGTIDILTGGFPCQPYSLAGMRKGTEDERHLWPQMLRAIQEIQPRYIVGENVPGLVNWSNGMVFEQIQVDLETEGYAVTPVLLPAAGVNAPHRRERIWFVAHSERQRLQGFNAKWQNLCLHQDQTFAEYSDRDVFKWFNKPRRTIKYLRDGNGIPSQLHKQGVKALGNAIVPQIAHVIFKSIQQYETLTPHRQG